MKVLNFSIADHANFSHNNATALRTVGVDCVDIKLRHHPFKYESESVVVENTDVSDIFDKYDIIQIMHSDVEYIHLCIEKKKKFVVYHTGSNYRDNPDKFNEKSKDASLIFTDQCEFMSLVPPGSHYIATAVDVNKYTPVYKSLPHYNLAHFPSNIPTKGTSDIVRMIAPLANQCNFTYSQDKIPHSEQIKRMSKCDIYIELFKLELNGRPYGCYGVTAFEAAALGKIVVTNNIFPSAYASTYGHCPFVIANTEEDFFNSIQLLILSQPDYITSLQKDHRACMEQNHSFQATGERLKGLLESI